MSSGQTVNTYIKCDGDSCSAGVPFDYVGDEEWCRIQLRGEGWQCDGTGDWCPACVAKGSGK